MDSLPVRKLTSSARKSQKKFSSNDDNLFYTQLNEYETYSTIKPSFDMTLVQYFWRPTQICKKIAASARKIVFVTVSEQFY